MREKKKIIAITGGIVSGILIFGFLRTQLSGLEFLIAAMALFLIGMLIIGIRSGRNK